MSDYSLYRDSVKITNKQMVKELRKEYPKYSKVTHTMVMNPDNYGVKLLDEAECVLVSVFGSGKGITAKTKCKPVRTKPNRLVVYLDDVLNSRVRDVMVKLGYNTTQDFLEAALKSIVQQSEEEA